MFKLLRAPKNESKVHQRVLICNTDNNDQPFANTPKISRKNFFGNFFKITWKAEPLYWGRQENFFYKKTSLNLSFWLAYFVKTPNIFISEKKEFSNLTNFQSPKHFNQQTQIFSSKLQKIFYKTSIQFLS